MGKKQELHLKKLLRSEQVQMLLKDFASLLGPDVCLAISDEPDHLLESYPSFPPQVALALWKTAPEMVETTITQCGAATPICLEERTLGLILATGQLPEPTQVRTTLTALKHALESLAQAIREKRAIAIETLDRYREINLLYSLRKKLAICMDMDELSQRALIEATQIVQADQGAILLYNDRRELTIAARVETAQQPKSLKQEKSETILKKGFSIAEQVARTGKSQIVNDFRAYGEESTSLLAVPLLTSERHIGAILLTGKGEDASFTAGDEKLLSTLAWQAATSLENARLFDNVRRQRDEIATMKHYRDNVLASITSGVITIDTQDTIVTLNRAAETILRISARQAINRAYREALGFLRATPLPSLIENVLRHQNTYLDQEICPYIPKGEQLHLNVSLSPLQGGGGETLGVAIVMDDVTEKHRYEQERTLISRYLPSGLVDRLPNDLAKLGLRGERRVITSLFADIQGFTGFSEVNPPERVLEVVNGYMTLAEAAVRFNRGIVDKYEGDGVMILFNTPLLEDDEHALKAVRTAWALKKAVEAYHQHVPPDEQLHLGIGVCTGEAVVGNVGTEDRMEYTAIGDTVNISKRLQENAQIGQILICHTTWQLTRDWIQANSFPALRVEGRQAAIRIYELIDTVASAR
jgi:PAS domain S-box-containing protein